MSSALERIEERIEEIEREIATLAPIVNERARLLRARALILDQPEPEPKTSTPSSPRRVGRSDVFEYLTRNPGSHAGDVAAGLGVGQGAVSAHLYRGRGRLFAMRSGRWYPIPVAEASPV